MSRFLDDALDDDDRAYDLLKEDGWSNDDLLHRRHRAGGEYLGPKDELEEPSDG